MGIGISEFALRLLFLFYPGIICHLVMDGLTVHRERKPHQVFLYSFVLGVLSYLLYVIASAIFHFATQFRFGETDACVSYPELPQFFSSLTNSKVPLDFVEILWVTVFSVALAFLLSKALNDKWLVRIGNKLALSNSIGDPNIWCFSLNAKDIQWATVRLIDQKIMYQGYIRAFSDTEETRELLLTNVIAYNEVTGKQLYTSDRIYLSMTPENIVIELPSATTT